VSKLLIPLNLSNEDLRSSGDILPPVFVRPESLVVFVRGVFEQDAVFPAKAKLTGPATAVPRVKAMRGVSGGNR
jgi:hypothetical protein